MEKMNDQIREFAINGIDYMQIPIYAEHVRKYTIPVDITAEDEALLGVVVKEMVNRVH